MKISDIYKVIIFFTSVSLILIVFLVYPTLKDIKEGPNKILLDKEKILLINSEILELENFKKKYEEYKPNLEKIDGVFIDSKNPLDFIKFLEKLAFELGVDLDINLDPSIKGEETQKSNVVIFKVSAKSNFQSILKFSEKLETGPYLIKFQNLSMKKQSEILAKGQSPSNKIETNFLIEVASK